MSARLRVCWSIASVIFVLTLCTACRSTGNKSPKSSAQLKSDDMGKGDVCSSACSGLSSDTSGDSTRKWAVCYSCRCKAAMGGWLPTAEQISCDKGANVPIVGATKNGTSLDLSVISTESANCLNPPRLGAARAYGSGCFPGSKLGQLKKDNIYVKWICRLEKWTPMFSDSSIKYNDTGIIIHNSDSGATCYFDDKDNVIAGNDNPEIDLTDGKEEKVTKFLSTYYRTEGDSCVGCHDNDPFMYSPYLKGAGWQSSAAYTKQYYHRVTTSGTGQASLGEHLVSPGAESCTSCHRIAKGGGSCNYSIDSIGKSGIASPMIL